MALIDYCDNFSFPPYQFHTYYFCYGGQSAGLLEVHVLKKVSQEEDRSNFAAVTLADID
jgi:hypothetical protein